MDLNTKILFFGSLADRLGRQTEIELPAEGCTVAELRRLLGARDAEFAAALDAPGVRASADKALVRDDQQVTPAQEVSFFPILSGG